MKIYSEISLENFEAWSGAVDTMDTLRNLEAETGDNIFDNLESMIEEVMGDDMSETDLNDFLWFENDTIAEWLGYSDWEELERKADGEEDDEDEED